MNKKQHILPGIFFLTAFMLVIFFDSVLSMITDIGEHYVSSDGSIDVKGAFLLKLVLSVTIFSLFIVGISVYFNLTSKMMSISQQLVDWAALRQFFLTDDICNKKWLPLFSVIITTVYGSLLLAYVQQFGPPPAEGIMEELSSLLFLFSGIILVTAVVPLKNIKLQTDMRRDVTLTLVISAGCMFFIYGEEISWGQRIFGWTAEGVFEEYNWQQETNTHNFFNPLFRFIYPIVGIGSLIMLCFIWFFPKDRPYFYQLFIPPPYFFFVIVFMAASTFLHTEIYEQLLALFLLLHSFRILVSLKEMPRT